MILLLFDLYSSIYTDGSRKTKISPHDQQINVLIIIEVNGVNKLHDPEIILVLPRIVWVEVQTITEEEDNNSELFKFIVSSPIVLISLIFPSFSSLFPLDCG